MRAGTVFHERYEAHHFFFFEDSESWKAKRIVSVHHQGILDAEPLGQRAKHLLAGGSGIEFWTDDLHMTPNV